MRFMMLVASVVLVGVMGCSTSKPKPKPEFDVRYPVIKYLDPVTDKVPNVR